MMKAVKSLIRHGVSSNQVQDLTQRLKLDSRKKIYTNEPGMLLKISIVNFLQWA
jgi:hypothetical protein